MDKTKQQWLGIPFKRAGPYSSLLCKAMWAASHVVGSPGLGLMSFTTACAADPKRKFMQKFSPKPKFTHEFLSKGRNPLERKKERKKASAVPETSGHTDRNTKSTVNGNARSLLGETQ